MSCKRLSEAFNMLTSDPMIAKYVDLQCHNAFSLPLESKGEILPFEEVLFLH